MNRISVLGSLAIWMSLVFAPLEELSAIENWPCWRGPRGDGTSQETNLPLQWGPQENIAWKTPIPGEGHASPIVWEDRVYLISCDTKAHSRHLLAFDLQSGSLLWNKKVIDSPLETKHQLNSYASSTPATDGERIYVAFLQSDQRTVIATNVSAPREVTLGDMIVAAYDMNGERVWMAKPGPFVSVHGFCSCPVIHGDLVIVNGDHDGDSFIVALDKRTGREVWKVPRKNKTRSYCTPIVRSFAGRTQMILSGDKSVTSYDPTTGNTLWQMDGPTEQFVASMVDDGKRVFLTAGYPDKFILAIDPTGSGDITRSHKLWESRKNCSYVPSPIVVDPYLLLTSDDGIASCYDTATGERLWFTRLGGHYSASPIAAGGKVYFTSDDGITKVVRPGPTFELLQENALGESCYSSPAASRGSLFYRTTHHLIKIGR